MRIVVSFKDRETIKRLMSASKNFKNGCRLGLRKAGEMVSEEIKLAIKNPPKSGRKYPSMPQRSSAPGEAPAYQYGGLYRSTGYKTMSYDRMEVGYRAKYGLYVELGTVKMRPRPGISTAVSRKSASVAIAINTMINMEMSK